MTLNLHPLALDFHRRHQYVPTTVIEAAMVEGAELALVQVLNELRDLRVKMFEDRQRSNMSE